MRALAAAILAAVPCACSGATGTLAVALKTAPDSHVLDAVERLRVTLTNPHEVVESGRSSSGFNVALEVDAGNQTIGGLIVEGFDGAGALVACGQSPRFSISAINAEIAIYMASPRSIAAAPVAPSVALSDVATSSLSFGAVLAGGRDAGGAPSSALFVYNAFDHSLTEGLPLPAPRAGLAAATGTGGGVYLFGGTGPTGIAGTLWRFDSTVPPQGSYLTVTESAALARTGELIVPFAAERFLITGTPALTLERGTLAARSDVASLPAAGATLFLPNGQGSAVFTGDPMVMLIDGALQPLSVSSPGDAGATTLPDGRGVVIGGLDPAPVLDAFVIDGTTGAVTVVANALTTPRSRPAIAATSRHLIVAGGTDANGAPIASAEVLDVTTLAPLATLPILARTGSFAISLPNDQVLVGGGAPASTLLELFTPEPPP